MASERLLITGGAGFIGSHLCESLSKRFEVIALDNFSTGKRRNLRSLPVTLIRHDITKPFTRKLSKFGKFDFIFNLASPASPVDYRRLSIPTLLVGSLGMKNVLDFAKAHGARLLQASTSEVYGDPLIHPQKEDYWGNVNPIGARSMYDESKRYAESLCMAYAREGLSVVIARIFNSVLADQTTILFNDDDLHIEPFEDLTERISAAAPHRIRVPAFDPNDCKMKIFEVDAVIKHPYGRDAFMIKTRYGRSVKVTGDHSVFKKGPGGKPVAIPVRLLRKGDHVAIPGRLPVVEKDRNEIDAYTLLSKHLSEDELWGYVLEAESLGNEIRKGRREIIALLLNSGRYRRSRNPRKASHNACDRFIRTGTLPVYIARKLEITLPEKVRVRVNRGGARVFIPSRIPLTNDLLWLFGLVIAEGCLHVQPGKNYVLVISSDDAHIERAKMILEKHFGVHCVYLKAAGSRSPALRVNSKVLVHLFFALDVCVGDSRGRRFPTWALQLPLDRLKFFLDGFKDGDGTHSGKKIGKELCFDTTSRRLAEDLLLLLLRFGVVGSYGEYSTTFRKKYGERRFKFYRITVCEVSPYNILEWDNEVKQVLNATRTGDLVWATVREVRKCKTTAYVYDFSVPVAENFIGGSGVCCHNTYGPKMRLDDGRVVPNLVGQALRSEPLTVYGDGSQTRSFCHISDMVRGLEALAFSNFSGEVFNIGNPEEHTILEFAQLVKRLTGTPSEITYLPLPQDDPKRRKPDISKIKSALGWEPRVKLEDGLKETIEWFKGEVRKRR